MGKIQIRTTFFFTNPYLLQADNSSHLTSSIPIPDPNPEGHQFCFVSACHSYMQSMQASMTYEEKFWFSHCSVNFSMGLCPAHVLMQYVEIHYKKKKNPDQLTMIIECRGFSPAAFPAVWDFPCVSNLGSFLCGRLGLKILHRPFIGLWWLKI